MQTQRKHFKSILNFWRSRRRMPSYSEIMQLTGYKSKETVHKLTHKMEKMGLIERDDQGRIVPARNLTSIPVVGTVEAGFPSPAEEELAETMSLDEYLIDNKDATYILKVQGDSMIEAGIMPGDMVIVERCSDARDGDIIIAQVDNEWTVKYLRKRGRKVYLQAANSKYSPIEPKEELKIAAVVKAVVRKY